MLWGAIVQHVSSPSLLMGPVYHHSDYGRWLGLGGGGVEGVDVGETLCVYVKEKECLGERGGMKARLGDRGLKTQGPPNPPSTEILALNPNYGIVCCCGDLFLFLWQSFFLMDSLSLLFHLLLPLIIQWVDSWAEVFIIIMISSSSSGGSSRSSSSRIVAIPNICPDFILVVAI